MSTDTGQRIKTALVGLEEHVSDHADEIYACLTLATIVVASFWRLRFGVDFTDESFYAAITQRYALGDLPYLDEWNLRQTASLITVPYYWLYLKINGSTDGVVYFLRVVYFMVQLGTGWTIFRFAEKRVPRAFAMIAATLPIVFIPFGIPTCSYNTLGAMFFTAGSFTGLAALTNPPHERRARTFVISGILHGLACVAYPPLAVPVLLFTAMTRYAHASSQPQKDEDTHEIAPDDATENTSFEDWRPARNHIFGLVVVGVALGVLLIPGLLHHGVSAALEYEHMTTQVRGLDKAREVLHAAFDTHVPGGPGWLATLGVIGLVAKHYPKVRRYVLAGLVLWLASYFQDTQAGYTTNLNSVYASIYLGLLGGFFLIFIEWKKSGAEGRLLALAGWAPAVVAGFITAFATANVGCMNGGIGLFAAACLTMVLAPMSTDVGALPPVSRLVGALVMSAIPLSMLSVNLTTTYRSGEIATLTAEVRTGPFKGLRTIPDQTRAAEDFVRDIRATIGPAPRMLAYYDFPAAYLAAPVRPAFPTAWSDSRAQLSKLLPYYRDHSTGEGIVFVLTGMGSFSPELESLVQDPERLLLDGAWYQIYREPPPSAFGANIPSTK